MARLLISRRQPDRVVEAARAQYDVTVREAAEAMDREECVAALSAYDAILPTIGDAFSAEAFSAADEIRTRVLANFGVGYNHIDVEAAREAGIVVTNTPDVVTDATADIGMMLILMVARGASEGERMLRAGEWTGFDPLMMSGVHVSGKTVGIVGMGRIGKAVARRCHFGFGMEVVFHNRSKVTDPGLPARQLGGLHELMGAADFIVVCVPGGASTRHLIDADALAAMRADAFFVNISRGDVVDEAALIAALEARRIRGAGLDVYEKEPHVPEALRRLDNVSLLPHLGTAALEVREAMGLMALDNIHAVMEGRPAPNQV